VSDQNEKLESALGHKPPKDSARTQPKTARTEGQDTSEDAEKTLKRRTVGPTSVSDVSSDVSVLEQKLIPRKDALLSEGDLKAEREKRGKIEIAEEMLSAGWSVRETALETRLPKSLIEKISKKLNSAEHPRGGFRQAWNEKPYKEALARDEETEDEEGLLSSGWIEKIQRKIWKMKIEQSLMKKAGLIGDDGEEKRSGSIDLNQILLAKVVASGGNINGQELISFATALKGLFAPQQTVDPIETFKRLEEIKGQGVQQYKEISGAAFAAAKAEGDKNFTREVVNKAIETVSPLLKNIATKPANIPEPTPSIPPPMQVTQSELEGLSLPPHVPVAEAVETLPDNVGYSNIAKPDQARKLN